MVSYIAGAAAVTGVGGFYAYWNQEKVFYKAKQLKLEKARKILRYANDEHFELNEVECRTTDSVNLRGFLVRHRPSPLNDNVKRIVLYFHGTRSRLDRKIPMFKKTCESLQCDLLAFAYRGFTCSDPIKPTEEGLMLDCQAIADFFKKFS